jgi:hypothetical protein
MNSITRITPAFNFNASTFIHVYTPQKVDDTSTFGKMSVKMVDSVLGNGVNERVGCAIYGWQYPCGNKNSKRGMGSEERYVGGIGGICTLRNKG